MSKQRIDLHDKIINRLTAIEFSHIEKGKSWWHFQCSCGNKLITIGANVTVNRVKSCGCANTDGIKMSTYYKTIPIVDPEYSVLKQYQKNANNRNLEFLLTNDEFIRLISSNCHYCGSEPSNHFKKKYRKRELFYNGIDRFDNSIGYSVENCRTCCKICNWAKGTMGGKEFLSYIDKLVHYRKNVL